MTLDQAISALRDLNEEVPRPMRLPTESEVAKAEADLGVAFPPDYRRYLLEASDVTLGSLEPATLTRPKSHTHLPKLCKAAWASGVPRDQIPICEDNADYYCIDPAGRVRFVPHDGTSDESWPDLAAWIEQAWIEENG